MRVGVIIFYLSKLCKAKFFTLCGVIFLVHEAAADWWKGHPVPSGPVPPPPPKLFPRSPAPENEPCLKLNGSACNVGYRLMCFIGRAGVARETFFRLYCAPVALLFVSGVEWLNCRRKSKATRESFVGAWIMVSLLATLHDLTWKNNSGMAFASVHIFSGGVTGLWSSLTEYCQREIPVYSGKFQ